MNNEKNTTFKALFKLMFYLAKQQKAVIISALVIFVLFLLPINILFLAKGPAASMEYLIPIDGFLTLTLVFIPLIISLTLIPTIHEQIFKSNIIKRIRVVGIQPMTYIASTILLFTILNTIIFYLLSIIFVPLYWGLGFKIEINFGLLFAPIIMLIFTLTGMIIGMLKIPQIIKGVMIFIVILYIILLSNIVLIIGQYSSELKNIFTIIMIFINPLGVCMKFLQYSVSGTSVMSIADISLAIFYILSLTFVLISTTLLLTDLK